MVLLLSDGRLPTAADIDNRFLAFELEVGDVIWEPILDRNEVFESQRAGVVMFVVREGDTIRFTMTSETVAERYFYREFPPYVQHIVNQGQVIYPHG